MNIKIQTPNKKVSQKTISKIRKELMSISHLGERFSEAEVFLSQERDVPKENNKVCRISLAFFGENIVVQEKAEYFGNAAMAAIRTLRKHLKQKQEQHNQIADNIISTVNV